MSRSSWLEPPERAVTGSLRLFCFPYAGGGAGVFRDWARDLPEVIEVWPVRLPGRETRFGEEPFSQIELLLEAMTPALLPFLKGRFGLFGHSMGAAVCLESSR